MGVFGLWPVWRYSILKADLGKKSEMVVGDSRKMEFKIHQQPWEVTSLSPDQPVPLSEGPTGTVKEVAVMLQPWTLETPEQRQSWFHCWDHLMLRLSPHMPGLHWPREFMGSVDVSLLYVYEQVATYDCAGCTPHWSLEEEIHSVYLPSHKRNKENLSQTTKDTKQERERKCMKS